MPELLTWKVMRRHMGDRLYAVGDMRVAARADVQHLIGTVLEQDLKASAKAEPAPLNKAEVATPANKASTGRKAK